MDELISRQAAIDMMYKHFGTVATVDVPDGKFWNQAHVIRVLKDEVPPSQPGNNSDAISREQAIDALCNDYCGGHQDCKYYPNCENLKSIEQLPSAQPEIIRCRECKFASGDSRICMKFDHSPIGELDFCSFAERREVTT